MMSSLKFLQSFWTSLTRVLGRDTQESAEVKMFMTYVRDVPNGTETGTFLALDLGGTNFRVLLIDIDGDRFSMKNEIYAIPQEIMLGTGEQLFDHIADCLAKFMDKYKVKSKTLPLGFTFSFPCRQEGLTSARLVTWTKGFKCSGVENQDVVQLLRAAIAKRADIDIDVMAVVNDTTGTLMSCAHKNKQCRLGRHSWDWNKRMLHGEARKCRDVWVVETNRIETYVQGHHQHGSGVRFGESWHTGVCAHTL
uniref:Phosphotransferase n=1 Tax=Ixodes ricinus TaxID=34613 RepID=V5H3C6_IXORI